MARWMAVAVLVAGALGAWLLWPGARDVRGPAAMGGVCTVPTLEVAPAELPVAREAVPAVPESADEEEYEEDPPAPERPGPAQAMLRVRAVALESGAALEGIELELLALDEEDEEHEWRSSTQTDPARGLENDVLVTRADGTAEFLVEAEFGYRLRGQGENGLADEVVLELGSFAAGEERTVTLALPTRWTRRWEGRVVDAASEVPLVGAEVRIVVRDGAGEFALDVPLAQGTSGADGRAQLLLPAWETATALYRLPGYAPGSLWIGQGAREAEEPEPLPLHRLAQLTLVVQEHDGRPAAGVELRTHLAGIVAELQPGRWAQETDASGLATFLELPSGCGLRVSLSRGGHPLGRAEALGETIVLAPGEHRRIEVRLPGAGRIAGRLLDPRGAPLAGVPVQTTLLGRGFETSSVFAYLQETLHGADALIGPASAREADATTDPEGRFALSVPIGTYHVGAAPGGDVPALGKLVVVREDETSAVELVLARGLWIRGRLLDPRGEPASGARISCVGVNEALLWSRAETSSAEDGSFELGPLLPGRYTVSSFPGGEAHDAPFESVEVEAGTEGLELALILGGTLAVTVENALEDERVDLWLVREGTRLGTGRREQLSPGRYDLLALSDEGRCAFLPGYVIAPGHDHELLLTLSPGATVTLPEDAGEITSFALSIDGLPLPPTTFDRTVTVPPGHLRVEGQAWSSRARRETIATRERDLAPGDTWAVSFAD